MERATVLDYMKSQCLVGFDWLAGYIADITNAFISAEPLFAGQGPPVVQRVIKEMAKKQHEGCLLSNEEVKSLLFDTLDKFFGDAPEPAKEIPWPENENLLTRSELTKRLRRAESQQYSTEVERFKSRPRNIEYPGRLVEAAKRLEGCFHWVPSGPTDGTFFPKEKTSGGETNHFVEWIHGSGDEPGSRDNMNCWEAILFTAYKAGLVSIARLRVIHIKATLAGRANENYYHSLTDSLGFQASFPYLPSVGLIPMPGDIVFLDREEHVALCVESGFSVKVMSHWKRPKDGFCCYDIVEFVRPATELRFGSRPV